MNHDSFIYRFTFGDDPTMTFGLPPGGHVIFVAMIDGEEVKRKYTPLSDVLQPGYVDFVIKIYRKNEHPGFPAGGKMT